MCAFGGFLDGFLLLGIQLVEGLLADRQVIQERTCAVRFTYFCTSKKLADFQGERIFLCLDHAGLQRGKHLAESHRGRLRTDASPELNEHWNVRNTDFQSLGVIDGLDRFVAGQGNGRRGRSRPAGWFGLFLNLLLDLFAERAVHRLVHFRQVLEGIGRASRAAFGAQFWSDSPVMVMSAVPSCMPLIRSISLPRASFGNTLDFDLAVGQRLDFLGELQCPLVPRVFLIGEVAKLQRDIGRLDGVEQRSAVVAKVTRPAIFL